MSDVKKQTRVLIAEVSAIINSNQYNSATIQSDMNSLNVTIGGFITSDSFMHIMRYILERGGYHAYLNQGRLHIETII